jgi:hypothetical protein
METSRPRFRACRVAITSNISDSKDTALHFSSLDILPACASSVSISPTHTPRNLGT